MREELVLTTFQLMTTRGFMAIMTLIWGTTLLVSLPIIYMLNKTFYRSEQTTKENIKK